MKTIRRLSAIPELVKNNPGNVILSPLSIQTVLALTQLGAKGETALELTKGLHLPNSPEKIKEAFKTLLPKLKGDGLYSLDSANKIYVKEGLPVNPDFLKLSEEVFQAGLENVDFSNNVEASKNINEWVKGKTNGKISDLITPDMLDALTRLVLVNAVYFKGNWSSPFDAFGTKKRPFFKSEKDQIEVDMMHQTETFKYVENKDLDVKFLEIPYEAGDIIFTIAMPNKKEGLSALEKRLTDVFRPQNYTYERVSLFMPKFKIESKFTLIPALKELGIKRPFDSDLSDLSGFLLNNERLVISNVVQKAFINVTETGTEAAAATAVAVNRVYMASTLFDEPIKFEVDRPFIYYIKVDGHVLFAGRVSTP